MKAFVANIIQSPIAAFHNDGLKVFEVLETAYKNDTPTVLSFENVDRCATQFLNASVGKMYLLYDPLVLEKLITYEYGNLQHLPAKIAEVKENAVNSKEYDSLVENASA
jgi:hypothetical protein